MIDKIKCENRIGCDIHKELIAMWNELQKGWIPPSHITEEEYISVRDNKEKYPDYYVGYVGYHATFGAKYFGGYARVRQGNRNMPKEGIKNLKKQATLLKDIEFKCCNFLDLPKDKIKGYVIYCDIPYKGTSKYSTDSFPYKEFYKWAIEMAKNNTILISEYNMPSNFKCIWEKEAKVNLDSNKCSGDESNKRVEKLFICNAES